VVSRIFENVTKWKQRAWYQSLPKFIFQSLPNFIFNLLKFIFQINKVYNYFPLLIYEEVTLLAIKINTKLPDHRETGMEHVQNLLNSTYNFSIYNSTANDYMFSFLFALSDFLKDQE